MPAYRQGDAGSFLPTSPKPQPVLPGVPAFGSNDGLAAFPGEAPPVLALRALSIVSQAKTMFTVNTADPKVASFFFFALEDAAVV